MKRFGDVFLTEDSQCSYLSHEKSRFENFVALDLSGEETDFILSQGWRKFGPHFFRPACQSCKACLPLRVLTRDYIPTKSQKRVGKASAQVESRFLTLNYQSEYFDIYKRHSIAKFGSSPMNEEREFIEAFFIPSTTSMVHELRVENILVGVGFLDIGVKSLNSVYFCYDPDYQDLSLGNLSVLREILWAQQKNKPHYYLGYYIRENQHMSYKNRFSPHELYDWYTRSWKLATKE